MRILNGGVAALLGLTCALGAACTSSSSGDTSGSSSGVNRPDAGAGSSSSSSSGGGSSSGASSSSGGSSGASSSGGSSSGASSSGAASSSSGAASSSGGGSSGASSSSSGGSSGSSGSMTITAVQTGQVAAMTCVTVRGVVMSPVFDDPDDTFMMTARKSFYLSETGITTTAPNTGIVVSFNTDVTPPSLVVGDVVVLTAQYTEVFDNSSLRVTALCGSVTPDGTATPPAPMVVTLANAGHSGGGSMCPDPMPAWTDGMAAESLEGVLYTIEDGTVSAGVNFGSFEVSSGDVKLLVSDAMDQPGINVSPNIGATVDRITGFGAFSFCRRKIRPRSNADIMVTTPAANCGSAPTANHVLITEVRVSGSQNEFIELHNPTANAVDLSNYRIYNASYAGGTTADGGVNPPCHYWDRANAACGTDFNDFDVQFPEGAMLPAGGYVVVALTGAANYCADGSCTAPGRKPDFEIPPPATGCTVMPDAEVPDMRGTWETSADIFCGSNGSGGGFGFLSNNGEDVVVYGWDGMSSSNVQDVDYFIWGTGESYRSDKTGVGTYLADTAVGSQKPNTTAHQATSSYQRRCLNEGDEVATGGNGITGNDETSEDLANTFTLAAPTPWAPAQ